MQGLITITVALATLFASVHYSECVAVGAWTEPVIATKDGSAGVTTAIPEHTAAGTTGITLAAANAVAWSITAQPINGKLTIGAADGLLTLATPFDYEITGATYVIVVEGVNSVPDSTGTGTVTLTITDSSTADPVFTPNYMYVAVADQLAAGSAVATMASTGTTPTYTFAAGNGEGLFAIAAGAITVATGKTLDAKNTLGYILTIQSVATNTGTAFLIVCVGSSCSTGSSAINITGSLAMILAAVLMAKLRRE